MLKAGRGAYHFASLTLLACGSEKASEPSASAQPKIMVSAPISRALLPGGAGSSGSVVFVSAMPQAVPGGVQALMQGEDGQSAGIGMLDGGFDPIALTAADGEVITLSVSRGGGATTSEELAVRSGRPPRVVRTNPAPRRTDVPLNSVIRVVFSSPVDLESARAAILLVTGSGDGVPGTVEGAGLVAVDYVVTAGSLEPETTYRLDVTTGVRDILGQALAEPVSIEFRTGSTEEDSGTLDLAIDPSSIGMVAGARRQAQVTVVRTGSFTGAVALSVSNPAGVWASFNTYYISAGSTTTTFDVAADAAVAAGSKKIEISAIADGSSRLTATASLTIAVAVPSGSVSLAADSATLTAVVGAAAVTSTIAVARTGPFAGPVDLVVTDAPVGVTATISPVSATENSSILSVSSAPGAVNGTYLLVLRGSGEGIVDAIATVSLKVTGGLSGPFRYALTLDPSTIVVTSGGASAASIVTVTPSGRGLNLFPQFDLPWPTGLTVSGVPSHISTTVTLTVRAGAAVAAGTYLIRLDGEDTVGGITRARATLPVVVLAAPRMR